MMVMLVPRSQISCGCELGYPGHLQATVKHSGQTAPHRRLRPVSSRLLSNRFRTHPRLIASRVADYTKLENCEAMLSKFPTCSFDRKRSRRRHIPDLAKGPDRAPISNVRRQFNCFLGRPECELGHTSKTKLKFSRPAAGDFLSSPTVKKAGPRQTAPITFSARRRGRVMR